MFCPPPVYSLLTALALGTSGCERDRPLTTAPHAPQAAQQAQRDSVLPPNADTYIRQGNPNQNQGTELILRLAASGKNRALVRWDSQAVVGAIGGDSLVAARVELTVTLNSDNWGTTGRTIDLHRLTQAWTETGATWGCADDTDPSNPVADCAGATAWAMDGPDPRPYVTTPTASRLITNGLQGVVTFDVTADVRGIGSGGGAQHGWIVKKTDEGASGQVEFGSRESGSVPRLVLTAAALDTSRPPVPEQLNLPDDSTFTVVAPGDTLPIYYRNIVMIVFDDTTSGVTIRGLLRKYEGTIIGGAPAVGSMGAYLIQVPDPGADYAALDSLLERIEGEPGVSHTIPVTFRDLWDPKARYPTDGPGATRGDWFGSPTAATRPRLAVRAPLAWGCETGKYDPERVHVGVLDMVFPEQQHPDLHASLSLPGASDPLAPAPFLLGSTAQARRLRSHGVAAAGIIAATGDNEKGVAGMVWDADLRLFAFGRGTSLPRFPVPRLDSILKGAAVRGVRVISSSTGFGKAADTRTVRAIREALRAYLSSGLGNLVVVAAGQARPGTGPGLRVPLRPTFPTRNAFDRAAAQLIDSFPKQVLFVVGVDAQGAFWVPSDFYTGDTLIAAPATDIMTLAAEADFEEGTFAPTGNSYAAPFVAGVAAQILAMRPTLSGAEVGRYILRDSVINAGTGALEPRPTVPPPTGVTGRLYLLDAYGSLTLLSREQPDTPICGYPVSVVGNTIRLERDAAMGLVTPRTVAGVDALSALSVAQGGRRIAVRAFGGTAGSGQVLVLNHLGAQLGPPLSVHILERRYLERDSLDVILESRTTSCGVTPRTVLIRRGPSGTARLEPADRVAPSGVEATDVTGVPVRITAASPTGDRVAVAGTYGLGPDCIDTIQYRLDVIPFDANTLLDTVARFDISCGGSICPILDQPGTWSHDARRLLLPIVDLVWVVDTVTQLFRATGVRHTRLVQFISGTPRDTTFLGRGLVYPGFSADDSVATFAEFEQVDQSGFATECSLTRRRAANLTLLTSAPRDVALCQFFAPGPGQIFNLRARLVAAVAQPADAARVVTGMGSAPVRRTLPSTYVSGGARRVQAN